MNPSQTERTIVFGAERNLIGTLTMPANMASAAAPQYAVLLTNVGIMPRCGPYRLNVDIARRFAAIGVPTMRFDLGGLGDSARPAQALPHPQQWIQDTRAAMDGAERELGVRQFVMIGVCSGADVAYLTAPEDARLRGVVMFDPYLYPTRKARLIGLLNRLHARGLGGTCGAALRSIHRRASGMFARLDAKRAPAEPPLIYGRSSIPPLHVFAERIGRIVNGGTRVLLLVSGSYPYDHNYKEQTADNLRPFGLAGKVEYDYIPDADHVLLGVPGRARFVERSIAFAQRLFTPPAGGGTAAAQPHLLQSAAIAAGT